MGFRQDRAGHARRKAAAVLLISAVLVFLSGCMYPKQMRKENQASVTESVIVVQHAVDLYKERNGILPIKNSTEETPIYEKYVLDLKKLTQGPYLGTIPPIAFENGGSFLFVLVNPENKPAVKLLDVKAHQQTADIQRVVDDYRKANDGQLPLGEPAGDDVYRIDFAKLGMPQQQTASRYSPQYLGFLMDARGTVAIDYAPEIMKKLQEKGVTPPPETDLRTYLVDDSLYVPIRSFPYFWSNNEPRAVSR